ncbi:MAG: hypothetical protein IIC41_02405, partial [Candidatus Marinimicrobia bacterium]|nr:hypothetical protein [Candidatus Neomarinimicrobiota bacterium]
MLMSSDAPIAVTYDPDWEAKWAKRFQDPLEDAETFRLNADGFVSDIGGHPATLSEIEGQYWRSEVLVDRQRWVILGAASYSDTLELLRLNTDFEEVTAGIFLPVRTTIHFNLDERFIQRLPQGPRRRKHRGGADHQPREGTGGAGEAVIEFSNYRVNQGLPDDLFVQAKEEEN